MAPNAASRHSPKSSPSQETIVLPKRSLRTRSSSTVMTTTTDGVGGESEKDNGGVKNESDGHDARVNGVEPRKRKRSPSMITTALESHREKRGSGNKSKETLEQIQFREFVRKIESVLLDHDPTPTLLHFPLPAPNEIETPNPKRTKVESPEEGYTVASKLSNNYYTNINQIEDDLLVATKGVLSNLPVDTQPYKAVTTFFTFAQDILLNRPQPDAKPTPHTLRSSITNGVTTDATTSVPQIPAVRPPFRESLYTIGPNGPLFTSIASRDVTPSVSNKLPPSLTLPTLTGGTFVASAVAIVPTNMSSSVRRTLTDSSRMRATFPNRKRGDFSGDTLGKLQVTKWLDWGSHASFAPEWDDGGVGGGFGAEGMVLDWAYRRLRIEKKPKPQPINNDVVMTTVEEESIDEKLLLEWEERKVPEDLANGDLEEDEGVMTVDETLEGLRGMILLLGQLQTLRMANGNNEVPDEERALAENIVATFQTLIVTYSVPPSALISSLPEDAYNIINLTHPEYVGSLPPRKMQAWTPPQPPQNQRPVTHSQPSRPLYGSAIPAQQRLAPSPSIQGYGRGQPITPMNRQYLTPGSTPGYPPGQMYSSPPVGTYRGVGRPRKYDIRR